MPEAPAASAGDRTKLHVRTVFVSDVHLGLPDSKAEQAAHFLRHTRCTKLVLNGDIIDAWHLRRVGGWNKAHTHFVRTVLRKMEKENTQVIYLRGNHDDILDRFIPIALDNLTLTGEHLHPTAAGDYLVVHGDGFDLVTTRYPWIARMGSIGYHLLLRLNRLCNGWRRLRGKQGFSLSRWIKLKVKSAVNLIGRYEEQLQQLARAKGCRGIICGHIHCPADKLIDDIHYLNSGDWVESLTALVEHLDGRLEVITYDQFCRRTGRAPKGDVATMPHPDKNTPRPAR